MQAVTLHQAGKLDEAAAVYQSLLASNPKNSDALHYLGLIAFQQQRYPDAIQMIEAAIKVNRKVPAFQCNLGNAYKGFGQLDSAVAAYHEALRLDPQFQAAHSNLGNALKEQGRLDEAVASYQRSLKLKPNSAETHNSLGIALYLQCKLDAAVASYRTALLLNPDYAEAYSNLGNALQDLVKLDDAVAGYQHALRLKPDYAEAHSNLGNTLQKLGRIVEALESHRRSIQLKPDLIEARSKLLFTLNYSNQHTAEEYLEEARQFGRLLSNRIATPYTEWLCNPQPERLRVGIVSGDLCNHPVGYFLEGLLSQINPERIELFAYPTDPKSDTLTARIKPNFAKWHPVFGLNDEAAAKLIHSDGIHVLLDVSGHSGKNRLPVFGWSPAPVQLTWLALPATTGVNEMDYVLGDAQAIPPEHGHHFSETVWRMPENYLCFSPSTCPVDVSPLPALSTGVVTFGSFNNLTKMNDAVVALWARILHAVPNSHLYLKTSQLNDPSVREQTLQRFVSQDIAPQRLLLNGTQGTMADHLAEYQKIDIALDTFPYPGVTTSFDALWMGVPVLSLQGDRFMSLSAKTIAYHAGLPDWIATDQNDYLAKAVAFTSDLSHLADLRAGLRSQVLASPLFDAPRFARNFENALWGMWQDKTQRTPTIMKQMQPV